MIFPPIPSNWSFVLWCMGAQNGTLTGTIYIKVHTESDYFRQLCKAPLHSPPGRIAHHRPRAFSHYHRHPDSHHRPGPSYYNLPENFSPPPIRAASTSTRLGKVAKLSRWLVVMTGGRPGQMVCLGVSYIIVSKLGASCIIAYIFSYPAF
ncbi:hypothetical protein EDC01DRAFT_655184 [Geopyxis carbonaria]|nr:hypothetical protein EDC01DRAFT_655184 [Geopyxis carbonaria]